MQFQHEAFCERDVKMKPKLSTEMKFGAFFPCTYFHSSGAGGPVINDSLALFGYRHTRGNILPPRISYVMLGYKAFRVVKPALLVSGSGIIIPPFKNWFKDER